MAQPFSPQQRDTIREKLKESARKYAVSTGVKKTSLDMLTADAGISKSSFYKFYDSKELLFLEIAADWESQIIAAVNESLESSIGMDDKRRAANMVYTAFETIHNLGIIRFLCEDLPELARFIPEEDARTHYLSSAQGIFDMLRRAKIHFSQSDETVLAAIRILYLSIININRIERISSPRCTCWSSAHAKSWSRNVKGLSFSETAPLFSGIKNSYGAPSKRSLILYAPFVHGKNRVGLNEFLPSSYKLIPNASLFGGRLKSSPPMADSDDEKTPKVRMTKP